MELTKERSDCCQGHAYAENGNWQIEVGLHVLRKDGYITDFGYQGRGGNQKRELKLCT